VAGGLVVVLAFLVASSPASNSDLWMNLASGRSLAEGSYRFGSDPLAHTTGGTTWVNLSWLYDLLLYGAYQSLGGTGLVVLKAVVAALLAGLLLALGRAGDGLGLSATCTALSVVALAPYLALQSTLVSYLGVALTLWLLDRGRGRPGSFRAYWPLLVLFALWANLDRWFFLGPLTVALYGLGEALGEWTAAPEARRPTRTLGLVLLAGVAVCLLNPYHVRAFDLLPLLNPGAEVVGDPQFGGPLVSPLLAFWARPERMLIPANLAYLALAILGVISFPLSWAGWRGGQVPARRCFFLPRVWVPLWLGFFLLSAWQARLVPFFAIVAGPILARNLQETLGSRQSAVGSRRYRALGAFCLLLSAACLLICAWPGWLQGPPYGPRRWSVEPDPSLREAALHLGRLQDEGRLGVKRVSFNLSPEATDYLAWFAPAVKCFPDRPAPYEQAASEDYLAVRRALTEEARGGAGAPDWRALLRARGVDHLIVSDPRQASLSRALRLLLRNPSEWPLLYLRGRVAIFGWRDPNRPGATNDFADLEVHLTERAFNPPPEQRAPPAGPGLYPRPRNWWDDCFEPHPGRNLDREEALFYLNHFEARRPDYAARHRLVWESGLAVLTVGMAVPGVGGPPAAGGLLPLRLGQISRQPLPKGASPGPETLEQLAYAWMTNHVAHRDDGPPGSALLAVRAARRALLANPNDALSYQALGEAYLRLLGDTRERAWASRFPLLAQLRRVQAITALKHAVRLRPNTPGPHASLAKLYRGMGYQDLALEHLRQRLQLLEAAVPQSGETPEQFSGRAGALGEEVRRLGRKVRDDLRLHRVSSATQRVYERARRAEAQGLAGEALTTLLASDDTAFGVEGTTLELQLLLNCGRPAEVRAVRDRMTAQYKAVLGERAYHWLAAQLAAADGDYTQADRELAALQSPLVAVPELRVGRVPIRAAVALGLGALLLDAASPGPLPLSGDRARATAPFHRLAAELRSLADAQVLQGALALEAGECGRAEGHFRAALAFWRSEADAAAGGGLDFGGRPAAEGWLALLRAARNPQVRRQGP
jgi:hypothetical protein